MSRSGLIELACLYGPLLGAALLALAVRPDKRSAVGLLFSAAWVAALLPWVDALLRQAGFWSYQAVAIHVGGMPLSLYFGWVIGWGVFAPLLSKAIGGRPWMVVVLLAALDLRAMPELSPVLKVHHHWWLGELLVVLLLLVPALWLAAWTASKEKVDLRCLMLVPAFGGIILGLPLLLEGRGLEGVLEKWNALGPPWNSLLLAAAVFASLPGLSAVRDLALSGGGTPVPLDPPERLVTHGIYAFIRNPMQLSMTLLLFLEAVFLLSPWPLVMGVMGGIYSGGIARWSEETDMKARFGECWAGYKRSVRAWWPRWKPAVEEPCELWIAADGAQCAEVGAWFAERGPVGLCIRSASDWPGVPLERITWRHPQSGRTESGVAAVAMALQHLNFGWACMGWIACLPVISHVLQICFDAAGAGKRAGG